MEEPSQPISSGSDPVPEGRYETVNLEHVKRARREGLIRVASPLESALTLRAANQSPASRGFHHTAGATTERNLKGTTTERERATIKREGTSTEGENDYGEGRNSAAGYYLST